MGVVHSHNPSETFRRGGQGFCDRRQRQKGNGIRDAPWVEYSVRMEEGNNKIEVRTLPTLRIYAGRDARYAVSIDGGEARVFNIHEPDYSSEWRWNVLRGYARRQVDYAAETAGEHKVRIHFLDPGIVVQEITVR